MFNFTAILTDLQAAIAVVAARDRSLTVLLVAVWARIARMRTRLERLVALWRAGKLPKPRAPHARQDAPAAGTSARKQPRFPTAPAWLRARVWEAGAFGSQLQHLLTEAECAAFLEEVPQAGRILRPLLHMLGVSPVPNAVRKRAPAVIVAQAVATQRLAEPTVMEPATQFLAV